VISEALAAQLLHALIQTKGDRTQQTKHIPSYIPLILSLNKGAPERTLLFF
jgi:hypothetical protein